MKTNLIKGDYSFFLISKTSNACGWKCQVTIPVEASFYWDDCRRSLRVIVCQWCWDHLKGKWVFSNMNTALPFATVETPFALEGVTFHRELNRRPQFPAYFTTDLILSFCSCDLQHITGSWPPLTRDLLWPWSGVTASSRRPLKSQICDKAGRKSDVPRLRVENLRHISEFF